MPLPDGLGCPWEPLPAATVFSMGWASSMRSFVQNPVASPLVSGLPASTAGPCALGAAGLVDRFGDSRVRGEAAARTPCPEEAVEGDGDPAPSVLVSGFASRMRSSVQKPTTSSAVRPWLPLLLRTGGAWGTDLVSFFVAGWTASPREELVAAADSPTETAATPSTARTTNMPLLTTVEV
jgi:hypothetical protein